MDVKPKRCWYRWLPLLLAILLVGGGYAAIEWSKAKKLEQMNPNLFVPPAPSDPRLDGPAQEPTERPSVPIP